MKDALESSQKTGRAFCLMYVLLLFTCAVHTCLQKKMADATKRNSVADECEGPDGKRADAVNHQNRTSVENRNSSPRGGGGVR